MVVATFKNANRYVAPSKNVVAGPNAANCLAELVLPPDRPTKLVSTKDNNGCATHSPKQGNANLIYDPKDGNGGGGFVTSAPPPRGIDVEGDISFSFGSSSSPSPLFSDGNDNNNVLGRKFDLALVVRFDNDFKVAVGGTAG